SAGEFVLSPAGADAVADRSSLGATKGPGLLLRDRRGRWDPSATEGSWERDGIDLAAIESCVPAVLRSLLLAGGGDTEHRHASIAFVHFDGVDERLAAHGAAWTARSLDELVQDVQEAAAAHEVTLLASDIDHDGGKLILVSGVPRTFGDDEGRLLRAVDQLRRRRRAIPIRIGVNSGRVFAGAVGPPYRRTFTIMGDAVNLAARLMA